LCHFDEIIGLPDSFFPALTAASAAVEGEIIYP
jgi:hypothetical protein